MKQWPWLGRRGEALVLAQAIIFVAFISAPRWNPWAGQNVMADTTDARTLALWILGTTALVIAVSGLLQIRRYLTPLPYPVAHSALVTTGVYALIRHPLYACQLFAALGWTLYTLSLPHLVLLGVGFLFFDYKASLEERWLTERHPTYQAYAQRVRKLIPWIY